MPSSERTAIIGSEPLPIPSKTAPETLSDARSCHASPLVDTRTPPESTPSSSQPCQVGNLGDGLDLTAGVGTGAFGYLSQVTRDAVGPALQLPTDLNDHGEVDSEDLRIVVTNFNSTNGVADVNGDFKVDIIDLALVAIDFGRTHQSASIRTEHFYNRAGIAIRQVDGRGIATAYVVNELNQVVQITRGAAHSLLPPDPAEPQPLTDFQYLERFFYDFNDNLVLRQLEDRGNTSNVDGNPSRPDLPSNIPDPDPVGGPAFVDTVYIVR